MMVNRYFIVAMLLVFTSGLGQTTNGGQTEIIDDRRVRKQILVADVENRIRELDLAAPRVMARYRVASWLWTSEKDDIGRAEDLAVSAVEDLFKNRSEIPEVYFTSMLSGLFALLDRHSPRTSKALKEKHKFTGEEGVRQSLIGRGEGDRAAVDSAIRSISGGPNSDSDLSILLHRLEQGNSPERFRLLDAVIAVEERFPGRISGTTFSFIHPYYSRNDVPAATARRFANLLVNRARDASHQQFGAVDAWLDILNFSMPMIRERAPELIDDSNVILAVLTSRTSQNSRELRERNERINNSLNKLAAIVSEAEKTEDPLAKFELYRWASNVALSEGKFRQAVDLAMKFRAVDLTSSPLLIESQKGETELQLAKIMEHALKVQDDGSAIYAVERASDNYVRASGFGKIAQFYLDKGARDSARTTINSSLRSAAYIESLSRRAAVYFTLIPVAHGIDPTSVFEVNTLAAKSINTIPALTAEDKPETENFQNHVTSLMAVNWNLMPMLIDYAKTDRNGAADLAGRIEKKEVKVLADFILGLASLDDVKAPESGNDESDGV